MTSPGSGCFDRDQFRANLLKYTRQAYGMLPQMSSPRILDIGCGSGAATLELARISGGDVVGIDIDKNALGKLARQAEAEPMMSRITIVHASMRDMDFPKGSFDIIWTEGAISFIGFERGLREWRDLLIPNGCLTVHDVLTDAQKKIQITRACGYTLLGQFELSPDVWWDEYYAPMKNWLENMRATDSYDKGVIEEMRRAKGEIGEFDRESDQFGSVFFVLRKA